MAYPYLSDLVHAVTGLHLPLPIPMFGLFVALAMLTASHWLTAEVARLYANGRIGPLHYRSRGGQPARIAPPQEGISELTVWVMVAGIAGARLFHILENLDEFKAHPTAMIFTTSGLSIFGGLVVGTCVGVLWARWRRLALLPLLDAAAPAMMLGYAIGRIGCQVSGDGDWGRMADMAAKPSWLPDWFWAQTYEHNIVGTAIMAPGVYPTPLYEVIMAGACFLVLQRLRRHPFQPGWLFGLYLLLAGAERLLIEQIRINPKLDFVVARATQAEFISVLLIGAGVLTLLVRSRPHDAPQPADVR
jgi:phosphatidylglycerol:prolipoprotein diacylglycerol transferase